MERNIEFRQLQYFVTVADELHFSKAAEKLHITQQALSFQIKQLEEELGFTLFNRTTRNVEITRAGQELLTEVNLMFEHLRQGIANAQKATRGEIGQLTIGYISTTLYSITPYYVRIFRERYPYIELSLQEMVSPTLEQSVVEGKVDVCLMNLPHTLDSNVGYEIVHKERMMLAIPREHHLAQLNEIPFKLLANEPFVIYSRKYKKETYDRIIALCQNHGFSPNIIQEAASETAVISLVAAGLGIALTTEGLVSVRPHEVVYRLVTEPVFETPFIVGWDINNTSPIVQAFVSIAKENRYYSHLEFDSALTRS